LAQTNSATAEEYCIMTTELSAVEHAAAMQEMQPQMSRNRCVSQIPQRKQYLPLNAALDAIRALTWIVGIR
jgi:hypothetical protein